jgi:hypothetical protein
MSVSKGVQGNTIGATIAAQFNVPNMLSPADIKVMEKLHDRVERAPEGLLKEMAIKDMLDYMTTKMFYGGLVGNRWEKFTGATKRFFTGGGYWAAYYGNMLSGYSTQEANIFWSMSQLIVDSFSDILATGFNAIPAVLGNEAAQGRAKRAGARLGSMGRGFEHGRKLAGAALLFPSTNRHVERFNNFYKQFVGDSAYSSGVYRTLSLVSRVMAAMDTWANAIHYERYVSENMQINGNTRLGTQNLESREIMYNGTRMTIGEALDKEAKFLGEQIDLDTTGLDEMAQRLAKVRSRNKLRQMALRGARAVELYRQNVIEEYGIDATNFADTKTMRNTPTGALGALAMAYSRGVQPKEDDTILKTFAKFALRQTIPFLNTPLNVMQIVWDSSVSGAIFQFSDKKNTFSSNPIYDANQKVEKIRNLIANIDNGLQSFPTSNSLLTAKAKYEKQLEVAEKQVVLATEGAYRNLMSASYATLMGVSSIAAIVAQEMGDDEKNKKKMFAALMAVLASFSSKDNWLPNIKVKSGSGTFFDASKGEMAETSPAYQAEFHVAGKSFDFNYKLLPWMLTFTFAGNYMDRRIDEQGKPTADKANGLQVAGEVAAASLTGTILNSSGFLGAAGLVEWFTNLSERPGTSENRAVGLMTNIASSVIPIAPNIVKQVKQTSDGGERYFIEQKIENAPLMFLYKETGFAPYMEKRISLINGKPISYAIGEMSGGTALFNILVGETNTTYLRKNPTVGWLKDHFLLKVFPNKSFEKTTFVTESEGAIKGTEKIYNQYAEQMAGAYFEEIQKHIDSKEWTWKVASENRGRPHPKDMTIEEAKQAFKEGKFDTDATRNSKLYTDDKDIKYFLYKKAIEGIINTESNKARKEMGLALEEELTND